MPVAVFDLDETLIAADSDYLWGEFMVARDLVDGVTFTAQNDQFYADYKAGTLDIRAYLRFAMHFMTLYPVERLLELREEFVAEVIEPLLLPRARELVERHRAAGDDLVVVTATNEFITAPIVRHYGIDHLIAPIPEFADGRYTGDVAGVPSFREGKLTRLDAWLAEHGHNLDDSHGYSDSINDLPLLSKVTHPCAVDPDPSLRAEAEARGWNIISLRD